MITLETEHNTHAHVNRIVPMALDEDHKASA